MSARTTVKAIQDIMRKDVGVDGDAQRLSQLCWLFFLKIIDDQDQTIELTEDNYSSPIPEHLQWRSWAADEEGITGDGLLEFINQQVVGPLAPAPAHQPPAHDDAAIGERILAPHSLQQPAGLLQRRCDEAIADLGFAEGALGHRLAASGRTRAKARRDRAIREFGSQPSGLARAYKIDKSLGAALGPTSAPSGASPAG